MQHPPVTVIALCYNHARFLIECLDSIAAQTHQDFQLIVTDDASYDNSASLIRAWIAANRPDACFIEHQRNMGLCATLNSALAAAQGEYISMIATDDRWDPRKLDVQLDFMQHLPPTAAVVYSDAAVMDESGEDLGRSVIADHLRGATPPSGNIFSALADGNFIPAMSTLIRTSALQDVGGYDESLTYEDYDMWLRLAARGFEFMYCPGTFAHYRTVGTSMTNTVFIKPSTAHSHSLIVLHDRWFDSGLLNATQRDRWATKIAQSAYNLFVLDDPNAARCLWLAVRRTRNPKLLALALACTFGIKRDTGKRWLAALGFSRD